MPGLYGRRYPWRAGLRLPWRDPCCYPCKKTCRRHPVLRTFGRCKHEVARVVRECSPRWGEGSGFARFSPSPAVAGRFQAALAALLVAVSSVSLAGDIPWSIKGFGTLGAAGTDTDQLKFRRDTSQSNGVTRSGGIDVDSRLGLQLDADLSSSLHTTVQWVARSHDGDFFEQNLDWAFLRWRFRPDLDVRLGRVGFDVFMLSDYRNVGYVYPWIRPPHEFYAGLPPYHFDGADVAQRFAVGDGYLVAKGFAGYSFNQLPAGTAGTYDSGSVVAGGSLAYESGNWRARIGYAYTQARKEPPLGGLTSALRSPGIDVIWPGASSLAEDLSVTGRLVHYSSVGLAYDDGTWLAQIEGAYIDSEINLFPTVANGYLSAGRRFGAITLYSLFGIAHTLYDRIDVPAPLLPAPELLALRDAVDATLNGNGVDQKSVSLGVRWDVHENIALKTQWSHFWLGENGSQLWVEPSAGPTPDNVNVWSVAVDFLF